MPELKLEKWIYLGDEYAEEGERHLLLFFYVDEQLYRVTIAEHDIRFTLSLTSISKYFWFADESDNTITIEINGNPEGVFILNTEYGYRCTPHHPIDKSLFICTSKTIWDFFGSGSIIFSVEITFQFDNGNKKQEVSDLLDFAQQANVLMNQLLDKFVLMNTDFSPLEISPINEEETILTLQECVLLAYPEN